MHDIGSCRKPNLMKWNILSTQNHHFQARVRVLLATKDDYLLDLIFKLHEAVTLAAVL